MSQNQMQSMRDLQATLDLCRFIIEQSPVVLFRRSPAPDFRLVYVSENIARFGYSAAELLSGAVRFADLVHPDDRERLRAEIGQHEGDGSAAYAQRYRILTRGGEVRWVEDATSAVRDEAGNILFYQGVVADVTDRNAMEEELRRSEEKFRRIIETAAEGFVLLDADFRIQDVNEAYCRMLGYERGEIIGRTPLDFATEKYKSYVVANRERIQSAPMRILEGAYYHKSGRVVPVLIHGNTLTDAAGNFLGNVGFVTDLSEQKRSLFLAGEVLKSLLPREGPAVPGVELAGRCLPWEEIGGDYFDYVLHRSGRGVTVAVGDISGHGVDSALLMATARGVLREHLQRAGSLSEALAAANAALFGDFLATGRFMNMFLLCLDPAAGTMAWVRAGHDPALVYYPGEDRFVSLDGGGMPMGVTEAAPCLADDRMPLDRPCLVAIGTDGIWEARDLAGEMFGKERYRELLRSHAHLPAEAIVARMYEAVFHHSQGVKLQDDVTLVIVKFTPGTGPDGGVAMAYHI